VNQKHKKRLGLVSSPVKGTAYSVCHSIPETEAFRAKVKEVFAGGQSLSFEYRSDQSGNYYIRTLSPVMDGERVQAVSVISKNITAQKQAEMEARHSRLQLAHLERLAVIGEFTASLAHELRQPLTAILSNAQASLRFIQGNPPDIDEVRASLQDIIADDRRAVEFIKHLRAFFKKGEVNIPRGKPRGMFCLYRQCCAAP
jgi:C4-dicarboxylate-specific signal transduction histidine kinase